MILPPNALGEVKQEAQASDIRPNWSDVGPLCAEDQCPQYDGKRCRATGFRPDTYCEPTVKLMIEYLTLAKPQKVT